MFASFPFGVPYFGQGTQQAGVVVVHHPRIEHFFAGRRTVALLASVEVASFKAKASPATLTHPLFAASRTSEATFLASGNGRPPTIIDVSFE